MKLQVWYFKTVLLRIRTGISEREVSLSMMEYFTFTIPDSVKEMPVTKRGMNRLLCGLYRDLKIWERINHSF